jgi:formate hydrogenlyase transcriptional activator
MIGIVQIPESDLYRALFDLSQSIAGHDDLRSLCENLARVLRSVVSFDFLGLVLYDAATDELRLHVATNLNVPSEAPNCLPARDVNLPGWVWFHQRPLMLASPEEIAQWPELAPKMETLGVRSLVMVPLTTGERRIGVVGFGSHLPMRPSPEEVAFFGRVASEFAVTVDSYLTRQELKQERDRLEVLFDITNTLVSKLAWDDLLPAISEQLSRVVEHDMVALAVPAKTPGHLQLCALHLSPEIHMDFAQPSAPIEGLPTAEALRTGKPVVTNEVDFGRYPSPLYRQGIESGLESGCSIPLITQNRTCGALEIARLGHRPFSESEVRLLVQVASQIAIALENSMAYKELAEIKERLANEKLYLEDELLAGQDFGNMIGDSFAFQAVLRSVQIVAPTDATVLILGETGTGKELVARAIHDASPRSARSFVRVNCAAIPAGLLESELFGHEKGAFTSASAQKIGRFELADHGTLFLDEIGEIPLELQSKLLRAIQEQEFERLGGTRTIHADIRFVAATNRDLKVMVDEGKFRADLYYRLHVFPLTLPPLRERKDDIPQLVRYFVQRYAQRMKRPIESIPTPVMDALARYDWPGNVRELQNVLERSVILSSGPALEVALPELGDLGVPAPRAPRANGHSDGERERILRALQAAGGVVAGPAGAAARLGLKRTTLQSRMRKLNIGRHYN